MGEESGDSGISPASRTFGSLRPSVGPLLVDRASEGVAMPRTILVHLNVTVPDDDSRTFGEIGEAIEAALEVGSDDPT